jgi:hypothetical protein
VSARPARRPPSGTLSAFALFAAPAGGLFTCLLSGLALGWSDFALLPGVVLAGAVTAVFASRRRYPVPTTVLAAAGSAATVLLVLGALLVLVALLVGNAVENVD